MGSRLKDLACQLTKINAESKDPGRLREQIGEEALDLLSQSGVLRGTKWGMFAGNPFQPFTQTANLRPLDKWVEKKIRSIVPLHGLPHIYIPLVSRVWMYLLKDNFYIQSSSMYGLVNLVDKWEIEIHFDEVTRRQATSFLMDFPISILEEIIEISKTTIEEKQQALEAKLAGGSDVTQ